MNIKYYLGIVFFLITQSNQSQSLKLSLKAGYNLSNIEYNVIINGSSSGRKQHNKNSFYIGGEMEYPINLKAKNGTALKIGLMYSEQGYTFYETTTIINQINLPIVLKKRLFNDFSVLAGGYLGYISKVKDSWGTSINDYTNFDFGTTIGIEYEFDFGLYVETRYLYGLTDILKLEYPESFIEHENKNRVFQVGLGFNF
ncbi:porin family protein [uncultured Lutibacter sp.]|uniref:porin family protein n=1 Tax=uncultured Lutibacter sp. TaxID=437739 RepID=UPI0026238993|nr:porin family protein [uncultured Lutibacter sp.]